MKNPFHHPRKYLYLSLIWTSVILLGTLLPAFLFPNPPKELQIIGWDKIVHFILFAVWTFFIEKMLLTQYSQKLNVSITYTFILGLVFAAGTELLQTVMHQGRSGDFFDFLADMIALTISLIILFIRQRRKVRST